MLENKNDKRIILTRKMLKDTLISILKKKNIDSISITELCDSAGICRSTFYYHFDSVYSLYLSCIEDVEKDIGEIASSAKYGGGSEAKVLIMYEDIFRYAEENRDIFLAFLGEKNGIGIGEEFCKFIGKQSNTNTLNAVHLYCRQFVASGLATIVWMWLSDENRCSYHDFAMITYRMIHHGLSVLSEELSV